jgi:hypothetical protein
MRRVSVQQRVNLFLNYRGRDWTKIPSQPIYDGWDIHVLTHKSDDFVVCHARWAVGATTAVETTHLTLCGDLMRTQENNLICLTPNITRSLHLIKTEEFNKCFRTN